MPVAAISLAANDGQADGRQLDTGSKRTVDPLPPLGRGIAQRHECFVELSTFPCAADDV